MKDRLPEFAREKGVELEVPGVYEAVRKNSETAVGWEYAEEAQYLYRHAIGFKERYLDPVLRTDRGRLPDPVIGFDRMDIRVLAAYTLNRNPQGLLYEITFNKKHYQEKEDKMQWVWGRWAQLETLLHEQVHLWQQNFGQHPYQGGSSTHNKEFVDKSESLGLHPAPRWGYHTRIADGLFAQYMRELGVESPKDVPTEVKKGKKHWFKVSPKTPEKKGRSTLAKYTCECGHNIRVGKKDWPGAFCNECGSQYTKVEAKQQITPADSSPETDSD